MEAACRICQEVCLAWAEACLEWEEVCLAWAVECPNNHHKYLLNLKSQPYLLSNKLT